MKLDSFVTQKKFFNHCGDEKKFQFVFFLSLSSLVLAVLSVLWSIVLIQQNQIALEMHSRNLAVVDSNRYLKKSRPRALAIHISMNSESSGMITFEDGKHFYFPDQISELQSEIDLRVSNLLKSSFLSLKPGLSHSRLQIFPEENVSTEFLDRVISYFTQAGFDDFDLAVLERLQ